MKIKLKFILLALFVMSTYQCGKSIPIEEMGNAKYLVSKAESVKAYDYAPEEYEAAKKALFDVHEHISDGNMGDAKEKALEAQRLAQKAFDLSVPKLVQATREEAEKAIKEAELRFASEFAQEGFKNSNDFLAQGRQLQEEGKHGKAYQKFEAAREEAVKAQSIAEAQIESMKNEMKEVDDILAEAAKNGAKERFPDDYNKAKNLLKTANEQFDAKNIKESNAALKESHAIAEKLLNDSLEAKARKNYEDAKQYVNGVEKDYKNLKEQIDSNAKLKEYFSEDPEASETMLAVETSLKAANESLDLGRDSLDNRAYSDSNSHSDEAKRLAKIVDDQLPQIVVLAKGQGVTLRGIKIASAQTQEGVDSSRLPDGWQKYRVKYNPARRDCLWRIAGYGHIYDDPRLWPRIYKTNKSQIKNPDLIFPGQVFEIPPKSGSTERSQIETNSVEQDAGNIDTDNIEEKENSSIYEGEDGSNNKEKSGEDSLNVE